MPHESEQFGAVVSRRELCGLIHSEKVYRSSCQLPTHTHTDLYFCTIVRGDCKEYGQGSEKLYGQSTTVFHPAGDVHRNEFGPDGGHASSLEFSDAWQPRLKNCSEWLEQQSVHQNDTVSWLALRLRREFQEYDEATPLAVEALALELLCMLARRNKQRPIDRTPPVWLKRIEQFLNEHSGEPISMNQLSLIAGVHSVHLIRTFRKFHGVTVGDYLRRRRIETACHLLQSTRLSVTEIALQAGFYDQSHFTRTFRAIVGLNPSVFRSQGEIR